MVILEKLFGRCGFFFFVATNSNRRMEIPFQNTLVDVKNNLYCANSRHLRRFAFAWKCVLLTKLVSYHPYIRFDMLYCGCWRFDVRLKLCNINKGKKCEAIEKSSTETQTTQFVVRHSTSNSQKCHMLLSIAMVFSVAFILR